MLIGVLAVTLVGVILHPAGAATEEDMATCGAGGRDASSGMPTVAGCGGRLRTPITLGDAEPAAERFEPHGTTRIVGSSAWKSPDMAAIVGVRSVCLAVGVPATPDGGRLPGLTSDG